MSINKRLPWEVHKNKYAQIGIENICIFKKTDYWLFAHYAESKTADQFQPFVYYANCNKHYYAQEMVCNSGIMRIQEEGLDNTWT